LYFKGSFVRATEDECKNIFDRGRIIGEKMIEKYPKSVSINFWLAALWGKWAKNFGPVKAVYEGAAAKIMTYASDAAAIDPIYNDGGGYSVLGMLHFYAPYIPFVLTWPSNEEALTYFKKACSIASTISNKYCLAMAHYKNGNRNKAVQLLNESLSMKPRKDKLIEDRNRQSQARLFLADLMN